MSRGGATPKTAPTGWAYFKSDCTIRWQRGDGEAYVLRGNKVGKWTSEDVIGTFPVPRTGWSDLEDIKLAGENWVKAKHKFCPMCRRHS